MAFPESLLGCLSGDVQGGADDGPRAIGVAGGLDGFAQVVLGGAGAVTPPHPRRPTRARTRSHAQPTPRSPSSPAPDQEDRARLRFVDDEIVAAQTALIPWRGVLLTGAIAALGSVALILLQIVVFALHRPPATAAEFVDLMTRNPLLGLVSLDLIYSLNNVLVALVYLALVVVLWQRARSTAAIAGLLVVLGMATYLASNPSVEMLLLAREYAAAPLADRPALLAAGEVLVAAWRGTAFLTYYVLNGIALLLVGIALLRTRALGPAVAWWAVVAGVLMLVPSTFGVLGLVMSILSLLPWCVMCVLLASRLNALAASPSAAEPSAATERSGHGRT